MLKYPNTQKRELESVDHTAVSVTLIWKFFLFFKKNYLFGRESESMSAQAGVGTEGEGEAGFPSSRELNMGLDPRTPGS